MTYGGTPGATRQPRRDGGGAVGDAAAARDARPPHRGRAARPGRASRRPLASCALTHADPATLLTADLDEIRARVSAVLREATARLHGPDRPMPADLAGADLRDRDLVRADLRGALLIAADLAAPTWPGRPAGRGPRDADVRGARLADAWFLSQAQRTSPGATPPPSPLRLPPSLGLI